MNLNGVRTSNLPGYYLDIFWSKTGSLKRGIFDKRHLEGGMQSMAWYFLQWDGRLLQTQRFQPTSCQQEQNQISHSRKQVQLPQVLADFPGVSGRSYLTWHQHPWLLPLLMCKTCCSAGETRSTNVPFWIVMARSPFCALSGLPQCRLGEQALRYGRGWQGTAHWLELRRRAGNSTLPGAELMEAQEQCKCTEQPFLGRAGVKGTSRTVTRLVEHNKPTAFWWRVEDANAKPLPARNDFLKTFWSLDYFTAKTSV